MAVVGAIRPDGPHHYFDRFLFLSSTSTRRSSFRTFSSFSHAALSSRIASRLRSSRDFGGPQVNSTAIPVPPFPAGDRPARRNRPHGTQFLRWAAQGVNGEPIGWARCSELPVHCRFGWTICVVLKRASFSHVVRRGLPGAAERNGETRVRLAMSDGNRLCGLVPEQGIGIRSIPTVIEDWFDFGCKPQPPTGGRAEVAPVHLVPGYHSGAVRAASRRALRTGAGSCGVRRQASLRAASSFFARRSRPARRGRRGGAVPSGSSLPVRPARRDGRQAHRRAERAPPLEP